MNVQVKHCDIAIGFKVTLWRDEVQKHFCPCIKVRLFYYKKSLRSWALYVCVFFCKRSWPSGISQHQEPNWIYGSLRLSFYAQLLFLKCLDLKADNSFLSKNWQDFSQFFCYVFFVSKSIHYNHSSIVPNAIASLWFRPLTISTFSNLTDSDYSENTFSSFFQKDG